MQHHGQKVDPELAGSYRALPEKLSYTVSEVCLATGLGRTSIYEAMAQGSLKSIRACGRRLVLKADLEAWLTSFRTSA
jgi:excisionase family DNA binding protein